MSGTAKTTVRTARIEGNYELAVGPLTTCVDVGYMLSKLNHRLYRQGRQYSVKVDADLSSFEGNEAIEVFALMPTWYLKSAWRMAKKAYDDAVADELRMLNPDNVARWRDFRVGCGVYEWAIPAGDTDLLTNGGLVPQNYTIKGAADLAPSLDGFTQGEYNLSYAHNLDTGVDMIWHLGDSTASKFSIISEYQKSRNESASPETIITEMPYEALKAEGEDSDYVEVQANGNEPPYEADGFPNQLWVRVGILNNQSGRSKMSTGYFDAPLGMVLCKSTGSGSALVRRDVSLTVKEGTYHGVHAPSM